MLASSFLFTSIIDNISFHLGSNHAVETLDVLMKEAEEMEINEEVVVIHGEKEIHFSHSIASSKYFDATQFILCFATVFILL